MVETAAKERRHLATHSGASGFAHNPLLTDASLDDIASRTPTAFIKCVSPGGGDDARLS